jgi:hypothetical protein
VEPLSPSSSLQSAYRIPLSPRTRKPPGISSAGSNGAPENSKAAGDLHRQGTQNAARLSCEAELHGHVFTQERVRPNAAQALTAIRRLRDHADDIRQILSGGEPDDQRRIFTRTVRSVTWIRPQERFELRLVLPHPEPEESRVDYVRARGGIRTHMSRRTGGFKPPAYPVPPPGR